MLGLLGLALITACAPPPPVQRAGWRAEGADMAALLAADPARLRQIGDLTADVGFSIRSVGSASGSILFRPPELMRLDVRGPLFRHILTAVLDGGLLVARAEGRTMRLPTRDGLDAFLDIDLAGYDPRLVLLGVVAPPQVAIVARDYPRADRVRLRIDDGIPGQRRLLWIDLHRGFVDTEELVADDGRVLWTRRLTGWRAVGDLYLPTLVRVESDERVLEVEYRSVTLDKGLADAAFFHGVDMGPE
jgi:hypothetical protein